MFCSRPQILGVQALLGFLGDGGHHGGLILAVGHAVPLIGALEHGNCRLALIDELAGHGGQEILALEGVLGQILTQPARKAAVGLVQEALAETPQVHADRCFHRQVIRALTGEGGAADAALIGLDAGALGHAVQGAVRVHHADTAGDGAVLGDGIFEQIAHHAVIVNCAVLMGGQILIDDLEGLGAVVIVRVDDSEGTINEAFCGQHGVAGAPGLDTALGDGEACGQFIQLLESVFHVHALRDAVADGGFESLLDLVLDDKDHGLKACAVGIVQGVLHNGLTLGAHRVDLLHAAVTAAHAGSHDHQYRFVHARKVIEEHPMGPLEWNGWKVYYYADDMVEFCTGSFGLIPSTTYKGFYYSEDDEPHGFQDVPVEFVKSGNGWSWAESEGDNTQYTERIAAHWYWYEAKF